MFTLIPGYLIHKILYVMYSKGHWLNGNMRTLKTSRQFYLEYREIQPTVTHNGDFSWSGY